MSRAEQKLVDIMVRTEEPIFETKNGYRAHYVNDTVVLLVWTLRHGWEAMQTYDSLSECIEHISGLTLNQFRRGGQS